MVATTQLVKLATLFALLVGLTLVHRADAAPFRPRPFSESERLAAKEECQLGGGKQFETVYHYQFGGSTPTSATTTCHGGKNDGQTCEISGSNKQCSMPLVPADGPSGAPPSGMIEPLDAISSPTVTAPGGEEIAAPESGAVEVTITGGVAQSTSVQADDERP